MTITLSSAKRVSTSKNKRSIWFAPLILLSVLAIISFYDSYKFNSVIYLSKYFAIILFILALVIYLSKSINWGGLITLAAFLGLISMLSFLNLPYSSSNIIMENFLNISMYVLVAVLAVFIFPKIPFEDFKVIISVIFAVVLLFVTLPSLINIPNLQLYTEFNDRLRYVSIFDNPNELSRFALLGSLLSVRLWFLYHGAIKRILFIFMFFSNIYLIYLTDSRTSLLSLVILISALLVIWIYKITPKYFFIGSASVLLSLSLAFIFYYINVIGINPVDDLNEATSGRIAIWASILNTDLFGYLFGTGPMLDTGSHNGYLEILKYFGFFGLFFWVIILSFLLFKKFRSSLKYLTTSKIIGLSIVLLVFVYHIFEGSMISVANLASIYFFLELSQRNE